MPVNPFFKYQVLSMNEGKVKVPKHISKWLYPYNAEREYEKELVKIAKGINKILENQIFQELNILTERAEYERGHESNSDFSITELVKLIIEKLSLSLILFIREKKLNSLTNTQASRISQYNKMQFMKVVRSAVSVNPIIIDSFLESQIKIFQVNNTRLITKMTTDQLEKMNEILYRNLSQGNSAKAIKKEIKESFKMSENRSKLIARDQTNKFNGNLAELRQKDLGITSYSWSGALDQRERETHLANEKKIFKWNKPSSITGHPGSQIQCRCVAQPIITDKMFEE